MLHKFTACLFPFPVYVNKNREHCKIQSLIVIIFHFKEDNKNKELKEATSNVYGNGHTSLFADVIDAIKNDRKPYVDAVAGRNALEMVLSIYKSQKEGKAVKLPLTDFASTDMKGEF